MATFDINVSVGTYNGGTGNDVFNFYTRGVYLHIYGNAGDDRFNFFADMPWYFELLGGRRNTISGGDGNDSFYGNGHTVAWLSGGPGDDLFTGFVWTNSEGAGALGGPGNDTYYVDPASPYPIIEYAGEGIDTVILTSSAPYIKPANVENVVIAGSPPPPPTGITGDNLDNSITGTSAADTIFGLGGNDTLSGLAGNDVLDGGTGNDRLYGGQGADQLKGGDGLDLLRGDAGRDEMWGGLGADTFVFNDGHFGGASAATCDVIHDFSALQGDRVRLNPVDANSTVDLDQAFTFIGTAGFSHTAGQLRYEQINGNTYIQGDTNGDAIADFWIQLDGLQALSSNNFFL